MLQLKTVDKETFTLLKDLKSHQILQEFSLAGGTGLALQIGHRISVDLDFFALSPFDSNHLLENLGTIYKISGAQPSVNSLSLFIEVQGKKIKVDFLRHNYPILNPVKEVEGIPLYSLEDIAAMKLNAIANRGAKKDFYDIYALLRYFSLQDLLGFFQKKYEQMNSLTVLKSLVYFEDADFEPDPISLDDISWVDIKKHIAKLIQRMP